MGKCCLDCSHFVMKRGWREVYCNERVLLDSSGDIKYFRWRTGGNNIVLTDRGRRMKNLNFDCKFFDSMDEEE